MTAVDTEIVQLRRSLHQYPELSGFEEHTSRRVIDYLTAFEPDGMLSNLGGHGVMASWLFDDRGPEIAIRCELDALPIRETNRFHYASKTDGVSHKCGHDGHMAIVLGLASWLSTRPFRAGRVRLLFQPAEENGQGALALLSDHRMQDFAPDYVFALHNLPGYPQHEILLINQQFNATVLSLAIFFKGLAAHAAQPEKGRNPSLAVYEASIAIQNLVNPDPADADYALVTPVYTRIGAPDYGISAGEGEVHFTLRTWAPERMDSLLDAIRQIITEAAERYQLGVSTEQFDYFPSVTNDEKCIDLISAAAKRLDLSVTGLTAPLGFGEDFGYFTQRAKGAMFGLGAGFETPPLHNDAYDFPDDLLTTGTSLFKEIIKGVLGAD